MINFNNIKNKIQYEEFFNLYPDLNQLTIDKNIFLTYYLSSNNDILKIIYIGSLNEYKFYLPIHSSEGTSLFILFTKEVKFNLKNANFAYLNNINIYSNILIFTKKSSLIKKTNLKLSTKEYSDFKFVLSEIESFNFNKIIEEFISL